MKTTKLLSLFTILTLCSLTFVSCYRPEPEEPSTEKQLTTKDIEGEWIYETSTTEIVWAFEDGLYDYNYYNSTYDYDDDDGGTYTVSDNLLKLKSDMTGGWQTLPISLNGKILTIDGIDYKREW